MWTAARAPGTERQGSENGRCGWRAPARYRLSRAVRTRLALALVGRLLEMFDEKVDEDAHA